MIPNRANYSGKTRRTSKIQWRKGRSFWRSAWSSLQGPLAPVSPVDCVPDLRPGVRVHGLEVVDGLVIGSCDGDLLELPPGVVRDPADHAVQQAALGRVERVLLRAVTWHGVRPTRAGFLAAIRLPDGSEFPIYQPRRPSPPRT